MSDNITIPPAIDLHVHFREPGSNKAETIKSGSKAALLGGYGLVCDMPNNPGNPTWTLQRLQQKQTLIKRKSYIPMATYAGAQPESDNLTELPKMAPLSIGLKLYGAPTTGNDFDYDATDFAPIVKLWHKVAPDKPIVLHSGRDNFKDFVALIAQKFKHPLHLAHANQVKDVKTVMRARKSGLSVTCGVCPHHIFKTSHSTTTEGWFARMQPPLADQAETEELFDLFAKGKIDVLETDHAPHPVENKWLAERQNPGGLRDASHAACFGVPGIEFALPLLFYQVKRGRISLERIIEATSANPAKIIGVKVSKKSKVSWRLDEYRIGHEYPKGLSGSGWTPYLNNLAVGKVQRISLDGQTIFHTGTAKVSGRTVLRDDTI